MELWLWTPTTTTGGVLVGFAISTLAGSLTEDGFRQFRMSHGQFHRAVQGLFGVI
jgi:hypothetical protein